MFTQLTTDVTDSSQMARCRWVVSTYSIEASNNDRYASIVYTPIIDLIIVGSNIAEYRSFYILLWLTEYLHKNVDEEIGSEEIYL